MSQILGKLTGCLGTFALSISLIVVCRFNEYFVDLEVGELAPLDKLVGLPDFDEAARLRLPTANYTYYRNGAAGEWSYRNNLEVFNRYAIRPRMMIDVTNLAASFP